MVKHVQHKPKPAAGWRELAGEIGVIVVGVLIALTAEQIVEALHWAHKVGEAENAMRLELAEDDAPQGFVRLAIGRCLDEQLDRMQTVVDSQGDRRAFLALARDYAPPARTWDNEAWQAAVASDVGVHMGADRMIRWSKPYRAMPYLSSVGVTEIRDLNGLRGVRDAPGRLSEAEADQLSLALRSVRQDNENTAMASVVFLRFAAGVGADLPVEAKRALLAEARAHFGAGCVVTPDPDAFKFTQLYAPGALRRMLKFEAAAK